MGSSQPVSSVSARPIAAASVKICGVRDVEHALVAVEAGAELVGMIFAPARRQVTAETAREISHTAHAANPAVRLVGVFVNAGSDEINATAVAAGLDLVQLSGDEPPGEIARINVGVVKAIRPLPGEDAGDVAERIAAYLAADVPPVAVLIDGFDPHAAGGTGVRANWPLVSDVSRQLGWPVGLAGGLTPGNVDRAIATARPLFVDTSSGVERDGVKDAGLIRAFVAGADRAFATEPDNGRSASAGGDDILRR